MLNGRLGKILASLIVLTMGAGLYLKNYIIQNQEIWQHRSDLLKVTFFSGDASVPKFFAILCYVDVILFFLLLAAISLIKRP
jgi:hypothetical protein